MDLGTTDVLRVLQFAAKRLRLEGVLGSCTACVVLIDHLQVCWGGGWVGGVCVLF